MIENCGECYRRWYCYIDPRECDKLTDSVSVTNADRIRNMTNETVREWISVKDRLPEEKVNCIVYYKHAYCDNDDYWAIGICFYNGEKFQFDPAYKVTHWMPMPQPPKGE